MSRRARGGAAVAAVLAAVVTVVAVAAVAGCGSDAGGGSGGSGGSSRSVAAARGGSGSEPELHAEGGFVPQPVMKDMAAGYVTVRNDGDADDRLTSVTSDLAQAVTLHTTEGSRMRATGGLDVPARGELTLARGGDHLMLEKLGHRPRVGEKVSLTLHFAKSGPIEVEVPVQPTTYRPGE